MAGILPNEGEHMVANLLFKNADVDRGTDLELGLFTNNSIGESTVETGVTEPSGGGYARITLTDANWIVTNDTADYPSQTFTAVGTDFTGSIYGYFIATTGTTPRLIAIENDPGGPYTITVGGSIAVAPKITIA